MIILCMDGLDPDLAKDYGLHMPHEAKLEVERELWLNNGVYDHPHTLHVWPSMFVGEIRQHPDLVHRRMPVRRGIRRWLHSKGVQWTRKRKAIRKPIAKVYNSSVKYEETVFSRYNSFIYHIPGIVDAFVMGITLQYIRETHNYWRVFATVSNILPYELIALYTGSPDSLAHLNMDVEFCYRDGFMRAKELKGKVMLVSDHGCDPETGKHTNHAYLGANFPFKAKSILDVRGIIEDNILRKTRG